MPAALWSGADASIARTMTLGNMRAQGVRSLSVSCSECHHAGVLSVDPWPDAVHVPSFGPRMACKVGTRRAPRANRRMAEHGAAPLEFNRDAPGPSGGRRVLQ
jgi:hypothetical protein